MLQENYNTMANKIALKESKIQINEYTAPEPSSADTKRKRKSIIASYQELLNVNMISKDEISYLKNLVPEHLDKNKPILDLFKEMTFRELIPVSNYFAELFDDHKKFFAEYIIKKNPRAKRWNVKIIGNQGNEWWFAAVPSEEVENAVSFLQKSGYKNIKVGKMDRYQTKRVSFTVD